MTMQSGRCALNDFQIAQWIGNSRPSARSIREKRTLRGIQ